MRLRDVMFVNDVIINDLFFFFLNDDSFHGHAPCTGCISACLMPAIHGTHNHTDMDTHTPNTHSDPEDMDTPCTQSDGEDTDYIPTSHYIPCTIPALGHNLRLLTEGRCMQSTRAHTHARLKDSQSRIVIGKQ